jgi:glycosyltransferase involved in cell wall biosynthesis
MMDEGMANLIHTMIYIDASRYSNTEKRTGVENYSYYLINELVKRFGKEITLLTPRKIQLDVRQRVIPFPRLWTLVRLSWEIFRDKTIDNLFVPSHVLPLVLPKQSVITIHDVVFRYSPESYSLPSRLYLNWATKFATKRASKIITPSEATKQDLIQFYKADPHKIHVVPLGYQALTQVPKEMEQQKLLSRLSLKTGSYFLYLGRIEYKKNTDTLITAFQKFAEKDQLVKLVLAGFPGHGGEEILKKIPAKLNNRILQVGYVSETEKIILLKNALSFIFPSRFEGFGLPLLEAMNTGVPIIASDIPSSREVARDCAEFFDKNNPDTLAGVMNMLSQEPKIRLRLIEQGQKRSQNYSWEKCATKIFGLLTDKSALLKS